MAEITKPSPTFGSILVQLGVPQSSRTVGQDGKCKVKKVGENPGFRQGIAHPARSLQTGILQGVDSGLRSRRLFNLA